MDLKPRIVVEVIARIEWPFPPKNIAEEAMREQANITVLAAGKKLEIASQVLIAEILNP